MAGATAVTRARPAIWAPGAGRPKATADSASWTRPKPRSLPRGRPWASKAGRVQFRFSDEHCDRLVQRAEGPGPRQAGRHDRPWAPQSPRLRGSGHVAADGRRRDPHRRAVGARRVDGDPVARMSHVPAEAPERLDQGRQPLVVPRGRSFSWGRSCGGLGWQSGCSDELDVLEQEDTHEIGVHVPCAEHGCRCSDREDTVRCGAGPQRVPNGHGLPRLRGDVQTRGYLCRAHATARVPLRMRPLMSKMTAMTARQRSQAVSGYAPCPRRGATDKSRHLLHRLSVRFSSCGR